MALGHFQSHALNGYAPVAGASVTVSIEATGALAVLKPNFDGTGSKANGAAFLTDSDGYFDFYVAGGWYKIEVTKDGSTKTWRYVPIGTAQAADLNDLLAGKRIKVRAATTGNITISTALNNGDSLDGLTLATNDLVLVWQQTDASQNGVWKVGVTPVRDTSFAAYDDHVGVFVAVTAGTANAGKYFAGMNNAGGTLGTTAIDFAQVVVALVNPPGASETVQGLVELATSVETLLGLSTSLAVHPAGLKSALDTKVGSEDIDTASVKTLSEYEAIGTKDANTMYVVLADPS